MASCEERKEGRSQCRLKSVQIATSSDFLSSLWAKVEGGFPALKSGCRKRGVEFKGGSLHDGFDGFGGSGKHLALLLLLLQNEYQETVSAVTAVSVMTAIPH